MTVLINDDFAVDVADWTVDAGTFTHVASEGSDFASGYASMAASSTVYQTFTAVTSGVLRLTLWVLDTATSAAATADTFIYLLPDSTVSSANSGAVFYLNRNSGSSTQWTLSYRDGTGFSDSSFSGLRGQWNKITVLLNVTARTWDVYVNDVLILQGLTSANGSFTQIDRVAVIAQSSASATYIDNVEVESAYAAPSTVTLIDHDFTADSGEIESLTPDTDNRNPDPQPWRIPSLTGYGGFTVGRTEPHQIPQLIAWLLSERRVMAVGEFQFKTSVAGVRYIGFVARMWDYPTAFGAGAVNFRIFVI
jgi:hypothetical protein